MGSILINIKHQLVFWSDDKEQLLGADAYQPYATKQQMND